MPYLLDKKEATSRYPERGAVAWVSYRTIDLVGKLRCTALVGIDDENPGTLRPLDTIITRGADGGEFRADHSRAGAAGAIDGVVQRIIFDNDDFTSPLHGRDARFD